MFNYAQLDNKGFCIGISSLHSKVQEDNMIAIEKYDTTYINRKYNMTNKQWLDEYYQQEEVIRSINQDKVISNDMNLENINLLVNINNQLNLIIEHLGIS